MPLESETCLNYLHVSIFTRIATNQSKNNLLSLEETRVRVLFLTSTQKMCKPKVEVTFLSLTCIMIMKVKISIEVNRKEVGCNGSVEVLMMQCLEYALYSIICLIYFSEGEGPCGV